MEKTIRFLLDDEIREIVNPDPTSSVLDYLRIQAGKPGTKEGCAEGDCGACTVVLGEATDQGIRYRAVNACIQLLPMLDGKQLITVESLKQLDGNLHPVQQAMVDEHGSQCGFCTPGIVMSLFAMYHDNSQAERKAIDLGLAGNLCRCTGYAPIVRAAEQSLSKKTDDQFSQNETRTMTQLKSLKRSQPLSLEYQNRLFFAPQTKSELADLLSRQPDACMVAGATDVGLWLTKQLRVLDTVIDVTRIPELQQITIDPEGSDSPRYIRIGATVTYTDAMETLCHYYPHFAESLERLGAQQVRNAGTIGGNIANGSPIGDTPPPLIALDAKLVLSSQSGSRTVLLEDFFIAYGKQDKHPGEFVEQILLPVHDSSVQFRCYKISKRFEQDISAVCGAFAVTLEGQQVVSARIAFGGMAATPKRARLCEDALTGQTWNEETIQQAKAALSNDFVPISDMRASAAYRMLVAQNLLQRFFLETNNNAHPMRLKQRKVSVHG